MCLPLAVCGGAYHRPFRSINRMGATCQAEDDVTALLREYRAAPNRRAAAEVAATLKRRHRMYPFPHALSSDDDRYGPCPPNIQLPSSYGFFSTIRSEVFHFKLNFTKYTCLALDDAILCSGRARYSFEDRVAELGRFRTRLSGRLYQRSTQALIGLAKQTCHQRQAFMMYYVYGLGSQCLILTPALRAPALRVITFSQTLLIAMCDLRPLSRREAHQGFTVAGRELFKALSQLRAVIVRDKRRQADPDWRMPADALLARDEEETTDTAATASEEDNHPVCVRAIEPLSCPRTEVPTRPKGICAYHTIVPCGRHRHMCMPRKFMHATRICACRHGFVHAACICAFLCHINHLLDCAHLNTHESPVLAALREISERAPGGACNVHRPRSHGAATWHLPQS